MTALQTGSRVTGWAGAASLLLIAATATSADEPPTNPHGSPDGCLACHLPGSGPGQVGAALPVVENCRTCHPTADMHPVMMAPVAQHVPDGWPLEDGLVTCHTCHGEPAHDRGEVFGEYYHRGGEYAVITDFCYRCHQRSDYQRADPHHPENARDPADPTCSACHAGEAAPGAAPEDAHLRFPSNRVCVTCHVEDIHLGAPMHLRKEVPEAQRAGLPAELALLNGQVMCWTCHEVHGHATEPRRRHRVSDGLRSLVTQHDWSELDEDNLVWPGDGDPDHPRLLALSVRDGALCMACHGRGPE